MEKPYGDYRDHEWTDAEVDSILCNLDVPADVAIELSQWHRDWQLRLMMGKSKPSFGSSC